MNIQNVAYTDKDQTSVTCEIDGVVTFIPCDESNTDWREILSQNIEPQSYIPIVTSKDIATETNRRRIAGPLIGGSRFRCDDGSIALMTGFKTALNSGTISEQSFMTAAGQEVVLKNVAEADAIINQMTAHISHILNKEVELNKLLLAQNLPEDWQDDSHWE